jgi:hypothetical protein
MQKTIANQFAETIATTGIKRVYDIVGDSLNGITDSIRRQGKIEWLHVRHEEVAAFPRGHRSASHRRKRGLRRKLRTRQPSPDQRVVQLSPGDQFAGASGDYVNVGQNQISIVDGDSFWVDGYFEELNIEPIHIGDRAQIKLMGYPEPVLGRVDSIARPINVANAQGVATLTRSSPGCGWRNGSRFAPISITCRGALSWQLE